MATSTCFCAILCHRKREHASLLAQQHELHQKHQLIRAMQSVTWQLRTGDQKWWLEEAKYGKTRENMDKRDVDHENGLNMLNVHDRDGCGQLVIAMMFVDLLFHASSQFQGWKDPPGPAKPIGFSPLPWDPWDTQDDIVAVSALKTMAPPEGHSWATSLLKDRKVWADSG